MRKAFIETISELARKDQRIILMTADLGFGVLEPFAAEFPERFFNVGVAEQNMVGLATGLAKEGLIPFVYSMGTFSALRPYEFIRNGPILHQLPVRIVGIGGGFDYGTAGSTHHSLEDIAVLRAQPGIRIFSPADSAQARSIIKSTCFSEGPVYYRLSKDEKPDIVNLNGRFNEFCAEEVRTGKNVCFVATGRISEEVLAAAQELETKHNLTSSVFILANLSANQSMDLPMQIKGFPLVVSVESHFIYGGLSSQVAEAMTGEGHTGRLLRLGVSKTTSSEGGDGAYLNAAHGLSREGIVRSVLTKITA